MKKIELTYRIHDPNPPEVTAAFLAKLFVEVNRNKLEDMMRSVDIKPVSESHKDAIS